MWLIESLGQIGIKSVVDGLDGSLSILGRTGLERIKVRHCGGGAGVGQVALLRAGGIDKRGGQRASEEGNKNSGGGKLHFGRKMNR
ncbi:hypothetical protein CRV24_004311 [Beauveria bassiana]|nr:hypothetical protein CRV24_004311 [Beauveria bassiana]KAH8710930.1 hypothetical protein HC256_007761 [Beauveria bassiana]